MKKIIAAIITFTLLSASVALAEPDTAEKTQPSPPPEAGVELTETDASPTASPEASEAPDASALPESSEKPTQSPAPAASPDTTAKELSDKFILNIDVTYRKYIIPSNAVIELYDTDDKLLGSCLRYVGWDTPSVTMEFDVPEYKMGTKFKLKLVSGLRSIWYYDRKAQVGGTIEVETYSYLDGEGNYVQNNGASVTANPEYEKEIHMYVTNKWYNDLEPRARIVDGVAMMPVRAIGEAMGLDVLYNPEWDSVTLSLEDKKAIFWANNEYMVYPDGDKNASHVPVYIEGALFVPVRDLAEAFECPLEVTDYGEFIDILIGEAPYHQVIRNRIPVNRDGIGSKTNYLIWVSKHEYKVRVYEGQQYHWKQLKEYPCALGAWDTPTITGQFEILERTQWNYNGYYVGPVLRFYNGYALHSTLLYYGGGEYDGRVGVNISHGCVRLHPSDINWIAATVPFKTRVYITE